MQHRWDTPSRKPCIPPVSPQGYMVTDEEKNKWNNKQDAISDLSTITNVGFDHMNVLGNTIKEIAINKLGVVKDNVPFVTIENDEINDLIIKSEKEIMDVINGQKVSDFKRIDLLTDDVIEIIDETDQNNLMDKKFGAKIDVNSATKK